MLNHTLRLASPYTPTRHRPHVQLTDVVHVVTCGV